MSRPKGSRTRAALLRPCGTEAAYQRHHYRGEAPCEACKRGHRLHVAALRTGRDPAPLTLLPALAGQPRPEGARVPAGRPPCWHCGTDRSQEGINYRGHRGLCVRDYRRWLDSGFTGACPPPVRRRVPGSPSGHYEDYCWLRDELGLGLAAAAIRVGVSRRQAERYETRRREQAA